MPVGLDPCGDVAWAYCLSAPSGIPLQWQHGVERQLDLERQHGKDPLDAGRDGAEAIGLVLIFSEPPSHSSGVPSKLQELLTIWSPPTT